MKKQHLLVIIFFSFLFTFVKVRSFDLFFYLKIAELENIFSPIRTNFFSYSFPDFPYRNYSYIFSELAYFVSSMAGLPALTILQSIIVAISYLFLAKSVHRKTSIIFLTTFLLLSIFTLRYRLLFRPHNLSYLFFAINVYVLVKRPRNYLLFLFLNQAFWVNTHNSFILGVVNLLLLYPYNRQLRIGLPKTLGVLILGSLLSPHFYLPFWEVINPFFGETKNIFNIIKVHEWQPTDARLYFSFYGMLVLASVYILLSEKKWQLTPFYLFYLLLSLRFVRFTDYFALVAFFVAIAGHRGLITSKDKKIKTWKLSAVAVLLLFCIKDYLYNPLIPYGYGTTDFFYPKGAVEFLKKRKISGNIFNSYAFGGYIIYYLYPDCKPLIDGRLCYPIDFIKLYADAHEKKDDFSKIVKNFPPDIFLIDFEHPKLALFITELKENYALVYFDDTSMLFLNRSRYFDEVAKDEYKYLNPVYVAGYVDAKDNLSMVKIELEKSLKTSPTNRGYVMYSNLLLQEGRYADAKAILQRVVDSESPNGKPEAYNNLGSIKLSEGDLKSAEKLFKKSLEFNNDFATGHFNLAQIYDEKEKYLLAFYHYKRYQNLSEDSISNETVERIEVMKKHLVFLAIRFVIGFFAICGILYIIFRRRFYKTS